MHDFMSLDGHKGRSEKGKVTQEKEESTHTLSIHRPACSLPVLGLEDEDEEESTLSHDSSICFLPPSLQPSVLSFFPNAVV
jgi:hypothetical protein